MQPPAEIFFEGFMRPTVADGPEKPSIKRNQGTDHQIVAAPGQAQAGFFKPVFYQADDLPRIVRNLELFHGRIVPKFTDGLDGLTRRVKQILSDTFLFLHQVFSFFDLRICIDFSARLYGGR